MALFRLVGSLEIQAGSGSMALIESSAVLPPPTCAPSQVGECLGALGPLGLHFCRPLFAENERVL
jgi:hypothetical protein